MADDVRVIVGTAVTVGGAMAALLAFAVRAVIARDVTPTLVKLGTEANALTREFQAFREAKDEERREVRRILADLDKIVQSHETRITILEQPTPPAASARKRRAA